MRFSTRGRRRKFCDEGAALSPPPPPFSRVPSPPPSLPCLACLALFLLVPPPDRCPHHFRVLFLFLPLSLALFLSLFLSSPSTAFFGRPSRHAAFEFSPSRCHCTTLAVLPSQRLYYRAPRPGLSVSHHARRPLVPGAHAWRKLSPYAAAAMVVSDELPKAPSKERGKVIFFFENLSLVPETSYVKEHFKLVFGSGTSDLAKIRPLKI